jgi:NTE family protein
MDGAVTPGPAAPAAGSAPARRRVNLALQGGGAHGAFTWGVLDRLLEDGRLDFDGVSGTSAGAMNGAALVYGLVTGGRERAREALDRFWGNVARQALLSPFQPSWIERLTGSANLDMVPGYAAFDMLARLYSPYVFNPLGWNPLRDVLRGVIDFEVLAEAQSTRLYVSATDVRRGKLKVFTGADISVDALLASACLPHLFQAVEIRGEHYWDGGYMGNPTIYPLIHSCAASDIVVVQINPIERATVPVTPTQILDRMNEVSFNATFLREARALELINRLLQNRQLDEGTCGLRPMFLHLIGDEDGMQDLTVSSKLNADWAFLNRLKEGGRRAAGRWLETSWERIGHESTFVVDSMFC